MQFDMSIGNLINTVMIAIGIGVCGLSLVQVGKAPIEKQSRKYLMVFLWMILGYITLHLVRELLNGIEGNAILISMRVDTFFEFLLSALMALMLSQMILFAANPKGIKWFLIGFLTLLAAHTALLIASQFNGMMYYFDDANVYHRGSLYLLSNLAPVAMMLVDMYLLIRYRRNFGKNVLIAFWIYLISPLVAVGIQAAYSEVQFVILGTVGSSAYMFGVISRDLTKKYEEQQVAAGRLDAELSMATRIQADMLPSIFPAFPNRTEFDVYASMTPAKEVGGDFYDFFFIDDDLLGLVIADVSGKGVPAALFMMAAKILVQNYAMMHRNPKAALEAANNQICQSNREDMFVTVWLGILDLKTGVLTAANAGHEYPVVKKPDGEFEFYQDKHGLVIGGMEGVRYKQYEIKLDRGAMLFLFTDGVAEATNANKELFGPDRLLDALNSVKDGSPKDVLKGVEQAVSAFVEDAPQFDDLTMLCLKYNGKE